MGHEAASEITIRNTRYPSPPHITHAATKTLSKECSLAFLASAPNHSGNLLRETVKNSLRAITPPFTDLLNLDATPYWRY
jgi:hypothetical protein